MSVRRFGKSWYVDVTWRGERKRIRSPDNTIAGARAFEQLVRRTLSDTGSLDELDPARRREQPTFAEFAERWMRDYVHGNNKPGTIREKEILLRVHLLPAFGRSRLSDVTAHAIERYKTAKLAEEQSPKSINNHLGVLSKCLRTALEWGELQSTPRIRPLRVPPRDPKYLTEEDLGRLVAAAPEPWRTATLVAARTGLRFGELAALDWSDVAVDEAGRLILHVARGMARGVMSTTKTNTIRYVPLPSDAAGALRRLTSGASSPCRDAPVFTIDERRIRHAQARHHLERACARAGLPRVGWHALRHTYASHLVQRGAPLATVRELLGHTTMQMTLRYAHLSMDSLVNAVRLLEPDSAAEFGPPAGNEAAPNTEPAR